MKPVNTITVPDVLPQFQEFYSLNKSWGPMSLVLLKENYKEAQFCYEESLKTNDQKVIALAKILCELTPTQRMKISKLVK